MNNFYKSKQWERLRQRVLRRDGYMCQWAKRYGRTQAATMVHHILPRDIFPQYQLCDWNLISLSNEGHEHMHDRSNGLLTAEGMRLAERVAREQGIDLKKPQ